MRKNPSTLIIAGGFDILHDGHKRFIINGIKTFKQTYGYSPDRLIIRLLTDDYLNSVKGKYRPLFSYSWRRQELYDFLSETLKNIKVFILPLFVDYSFYAKAKQGKWKSFLDEFLISLEMENKSLYVVQFPEWLKEAYYLCKRERKINCQMLPETKGVHSTMFLERLLQARKESLCKQRQVGALLLRDGKIILATHNGPTNGLTCARCPKFWAGRIGGKKLSRFVPCTFPHAEALAMRVALPGDDLLVTTSPCINCAKLIISKKIKRIVYLNEYPDPYPLYLMGKAGIMYRKAGL